jgi:hypothetical protein
MLAGAALAVPWQRASEQTSDYHHKIRAGMADIQWPKRGNLPSQEAMNLSSLNSFLRLRANLSLSKVNQETLSKLNRDFASGKLFGFSPTAMKEAMKNIAKRMEKNRRTRKSRPGIHLVIMVRFSLLHSALCSMTRSLNFT